MKYIRPMLLGMFVGSVASSVYLSRTGGAKQIPAKIRRTLELLNCVGRELGMAVRKHE